MRLIKCCHHKIESKNRNIVKYRQKSCINKSKLLENYFDYFHYSFWTYNKNLILLGFNIIRTICALDIYNIYNAFLIQGFNVWHARICNKVSAIHSDAMLDDLFSRKNAQNLYVTSFRDNIYIIKKETLHDEQ